MMETQAGMRFRHEAVLYAGEADFLDRLTPFVVDGIAAREPTLVMVDQAKIDALRQRVGSVDGGLVEYRDMRTVGANPARIIPVWEEFAARSSRAGADRMRGVGEPIWPGRAPAQLIECHWHEALINRAFAEASGFWLVCPYDVSALEPSVVEEAQRTHGAAGGPSAPLDSPLTEPNRISAEMTFDRDRLGALRSLVATEGARAGLSPSRLDDMVFAVSEVAVNSVTHGGGRGDARIWHDGDDLVCEIRDAGVISDPLADRREPSSDPANARGLWAANRLCDLIQMRSSHATGSVVRLLMHCGGATA